MRKTLIFFAVVVSSAVCAAEGLQTIEDVRVDALVSSHWGQKTDTGYSNSGSPCFNYFTPNNYPCGCCATPLAQLIRHWKYPASIQSGSSRCLVNGVEKTLAYGGGIYEYDAMPLVAAGADESARAAIGRLTFDCAASLHSMFAGGNTFAYGMFSFVQLRETFGYASAVGYVPFKSCGSFAALEDTIIANLDAKCPVMVSLATTANGVSHQALVDGYGYHAGELYFHFNMGWCNVRGDDAWYKLDKSVGHLNETAFYYDLIDGLIYNVFPDFSGDVLSGRVLDKDGNPVANAVVQASRNGKVIEQTTYTDTNGIYAFVLAGGVSYKVSCGGRTISVSLPASSSAKLMVSKNAEGNIWSDPFGPSFSDEGTLGGSSGNDILLSGESVDPAPVDPDPVDPDPVDPDPSGLGSFNPSKAGKGEYPYCGAVYDEKNNPCGTMTVKFTKPSKGTSKISATIKLIDGKSYSLSASPVPVGETKSATISEKTIKKLGSLDVLEVGEKGFVAEITAADGSKLSAATTDLSRGLSEGVHKFGVSGLPTEINGLMVVADMLPDGEGVPVNAKGKITLAKPSTLKYAKIKGSKPVVYELVRDTSKGKTNLSGLKLTYTAKTATIKGSFNVYTVDVAKHKVNKVSFTVNGMVIGGKAVGMATCKKPAVSCPIVIE